MPRFEQILKTKTRKKVSGAVAPSFSVYCLDHPSGLEDLGGSIGKEIASI